MSLSRLINKFRKDEEGSVVIEAVLMLPMLCWCWVAMFVYFDAFRASTIAEKAAYTLSDMLSREPNVTMEYIDTLYKLHGFITLSDENTKVRISVITYDEDEDQLDVIWTKNRGYASVGGNLTDGEANETSFSDRIPLMYDGEVLIVFESRIQHIPPLNVGLGEIEFHNFIVTRPRYTGQLCYDELGDGSDPNALVC